MKTLTEKAPSHLVQSIPVENDKMRSLSKEQSDVCISGLRPLIDGITYFRAERPMRIWLDNIAGSYAHRELYHGAMHFDGAEKQDCFIYHRTNQNYSWWSIEPLNDYATLSIHDGVRVACSKNDIDPINGKKFDIDIDNPELTPSKLLFNRLAKDFPFDNAESEKEFIRGKSHFDYWMTSVHLRQGIIKMIPIRYPDVEKFSEGELGWVKRFENKQGGIQEEILTFNEGWKLIRENGGIKRAFEAAQVKL